MKKVLLLVLAFCMFLVFPASASEGATFENENVSVALWNVRSMLASYNAGSDLPVEERIEGIKGVLRQLKDIGYINVESNDALGLDAAQWKQMMADLGITISSWHRGASSAALGSDRDAENEQWDQFFEDLGISNVYINWAGFNNATAAENFIKQAADFSAALASHGVTTSFHDHNQEFMQTENENNEVVLESALLQRIMDAIAQPDMDSKLQLDVHWAMRVGVNPITFIDDRPQQKTLTGILTSE